VRVANVFRGFMGQVRGPLGKILRRASIWSGWALTCAAPDDTPAVSAQTQLASASAADCELSLMRAQNRNFPEAFSGRVYA